MRLKAPAHAPWLNKWGRLNAKRPLPVIDGFLAATAKIRRMTLVTRNTDDIADLDI